MNSANMKDGYISIVLDLICVGSNKQTPLFANGGDLLVLLWPNLSSLNTLTHHFMELALAYYSYQLWAVEFRKTTSQQQRVTKHGSLHFYNSDLLILILL